MRRGRSHSPRRSSGFTSLAARNATAKAAESVALNTRRGAACFPYSEA